VKFPQNNQRFSRRPSTYKELLYICDGDCNGVFYYTGTSYGVHPWMNPALIKKLVVSASSPPSRFTDPKALVSRNYQGTSIAGPCNEGGGTSAWWKVDLGEDHEVSLYPRGHCYGKIDSKSHVVLCVSSSAKSSSSQVGSSAAHLQLLHCAT
jgi:hypothetical protein